MIQNTQLIAPQSTSWVVSSPPPMMNAPRKPVKIIRKAPLTASDWVRRAAAPTTVQTASSSTVRRGTVIDQSMYRGANARIASAFGRWPVLVES